MSAPSTPIGQMIQPLNSPPPLQQNPQYANLGGSPPPPFNGPFNGGNFIGNPQGNPQDTPPHNDVNGVNGGNGGNLGSNAKRVLNFNIE